MYQVVYIFTPRARFDYSGLVIYLPPIAQPYLYRQSCICLKKKSELPASAPHACTRPKPVSARVKHYLIELDVCRASVGRLGIESDHV